MKELLEVLDKMHESVCFEHYTNLFSRFTEIWNNQKALGIRYTLDEYTGLYIKYDETCNSLLFLEEEKVITKEKCESLYNEYVKNNEIQNKQSV